MRLKLLGGLLAAVLAAMVLAGCGDEAANDTASSAPQQAQTADGVTKSAANPQKMLVAYFSYADNTDIENVKSEQYDVLTTASIVEKDGKRYGVSQVMAQEIAKLTGADVFSIKTAEPYPADYDETTQQGKEERDTETLPQLAGTVDASGYDTVILVFPVWWYDAPMAVEAFLGQTDLSGKKVYVVGSSGGSDFAACVETVKRLAPNADVEEGVFLKKEASLHPEKAVDDWVREAKLAK